MKMYKNNNNESFEFEALESRVSNVQLLIKMNQIIQ